MLAIAATWLPPPPVASFSLQETRELGFQAMQFNSVVASNQVAVRLWQKHGFAIVGTLPKAYRHGSLGLVDCYVMYRWLDEGL